MLRSETARVPGSFEVNIFKKIAVDVIEDIKEREAAEINETRKKFKHVVTEIKGIKYIVYHGQTIPCIQCYMTPTKSKISLCRRHRATKQERLHPISYVQFANHFTRYFPDWENIIENGQSKVRKFHPFFNHSIPEQDPFMRQPHRELLNDIRGVQYVCEEVGQACLNCYGNGEEKYESICGNCIDDFSSGNAVLVRISYNEFIFNAALLNPQSFFTFYRPGIIDRSDNVIRDDFRHPIRQFIEISEDDYYDEGYVPWGME
jgi:hypothetical protein